MNKKHKNILKIFLAFLPVASVTSVLATWGSYSNVNSGNTNISPLNLGTYFYYAQVRDPWTGSTIAQRSQVYRYDNVAPTCTSVLTTGDAWLGSGSAPAKVVFSNCQDVHSGCNFSSGTSRLIYNHGESRSVSVRDNATNLGNCAPSPPAKIDYKPPQFLGAQARHDGLSLPLENLSQNGNAPTIFRAHDGAVAFRLKVADAPAGTHTNGYQSGQSGINFDTTTSPAIEAQIQSLENDIAAIEAQIPTEESERVGFARGIIESEDGGATPSLLQRLENRWDNFVTTNQTLISHDQTMREIDYESSHLDQKMIFIEEQINLIEDSLNATGPMDDEIAIIQDKIDSLTVEISQYQALIDSTQNAKTTTEQDIAQSLNGLRQHISNYINNPAGPLSTTTTINEVHNQYTIDIINYQNAIHQNTWAKKLKEDQLWHYQEQKNILEMQDDDALETLKSQKQQDLTDLQDQRDNLPDRSAERDEAEADYVSLTSLMQVPSGTLIQQIDDRRSRVILRENTSNNYYQNIQSLEADIITKQSQIAILEASANTQNTTKLTIRALSGNLNGKSQEIVELDETTISADAFEKDNINVVPNGSSRPFFSQSGTYKITLDVFDKAQTHISRNFYIKIVAGNAGNNFSINTNCNSTNMYANGSDSCQSQATLIDSYGNIIANRSATISIKGQNIEDTNSYDLFHHPSPITALKNGIRITGATGAVQPKKNTSSNSNGQFSFSLTSILPSVEILQSRVSSYTNARLMKVVSGDVPVEVKVRDVGPRGGANTQWSQSDQLLEVKFNPVMVSQLSDKNTIAVPPTDPLQFAIGDYQNICIFNVPLPNKNSGSRKSATITTWGYTHPNGSLMEENFSSGYTTSFSSGNGPDKQCVNTRLYAPSGFYEDLPVAFSSKIEYQTTDPATGTTRKITTPGGNLANTVPEGDLFNDSDINDAVEGDDGSIEGIVIGADIEGDIIVRSTDFSSQSENAEVRRASRLFSSQKDLRSAILSQTNNLTRNKTRITTPAILSHLDFNNSDSVQYYTSDVTLSGGVISGQGTLVIKDANLKIKGDMSYGDSAASLGIILINSTYQNTAPQKGNIYVYPNVQRIVGTYFSEGSFMSVNNTGQSSLTDTERQNILSQQLILTGALFTQNTFGGSLMKSGGGSYKTPWGSTLDRQEAQQYDYHFIRRYRPNDHTSDNVADNPQCSTNTNNPSLTAPSASKCDKNQHSFVLRLDQKASKNPPPGFETLGSFYK
jgi:hypothetical protein